VAMTVPEDHAPADVSLAHSAGRVPQSSSLSQRSTGARWGPVHSWWRYDARVHQPPGSAPIYENGRRPDQRRLTGLPPSLS